MTYSDHSALDAVACRGGALCTLVGIEGSFSRRLGAQISITPDGGTIGSLSDGCLERQLVAEARAARRFGAPAVVRFGAGSPYIDFRLPCGSGLDILVDPAPDPIAIGRARARVARRQSARLPLPLPTGLNTALLRERLYHPPLKILAFGEGPELRALAALANAFGGDLDVFDRKGEHGKAIDLGRIPVGLAADAWTAVVLLFHDHEWEHAILKWATTTPAFYIGAQGGARARIARAGSLLDHGVAADRIERIRSPIGLIPRARDPEVLALSVLSELVAEHAKLHPHP